MDILNLWQVNLIIYLIFELIWNQTHQYLSQRTKNDGTLAFILAISTGIIAFFMIPFFNLKFPTDIRVYIFLILSGILYGIYDKLMVSARKGIDSSTWPMLSQLSTVIMIFAGILFFKEKFILKKVIGALLIISSNVFIFFKKGKLKINKYLFIALMAIGCEAIAGILDVDIGGNFNLPFYVGMSFIIPGISILVFDKIKFNEVKEEIKTSNKIILCINIICWAIAGLFSLRTYLLGTVSIVAPLKASKILLNIIVGYIFLKERDNLPRKIIAGFGIILGIVLINI